MKAGAAQGAEVSRTFGLCDPLRDRVWVLGPEAIGCHAVLCCAVLGVPAAVHGCWGCLGAWVARSSLEVLQNKMW